MILWKTVFSAGDVGWLLIVAVVSTVLYLAGMIRIMFPQNATEAEAALWNSMPLHVAGLTIAWSLWIFTLSYAPCYGTIPKVDPNPRPMLSLQKMMEVEDAKQDETHLYGRGGLIGNASYAGMHGLMPNVGEDQPMFSARRPNYHIPLLLEFCFRWSSFLFVCLPLMMLWSRSFAGIRLTLLTVCWATLVYAPVVHAVSGDGWLEEYGSIDFSIGLVLLASCCSALLGRPRNPEPLSLFSTGRYSSIGIVLMWLGMSLHVSGYTFHADGRAVIAFVNMLIGSSCGLLIWSFCNSFLWKLPTTDNIAAGMLAGLAAVAPGAGVMLPQSALILGCCLVVVSNIVFHVAGRGRPLGAQVQLFLSQGICSMLGLLGAGFFATTGVAGLRWDKREILGAVQGNHSQLVMQGVAVVAVVGWSILITWILVWVIRPTRPAASNENLQ